jgi:hypothetical protein
MQGGDLVSHSHDGTERNEYYHHGTSLGYFSLNRMLLIQRCMHCIYKPVILIHDTPDS